MAKKDRALILTADKFEDFELFFPYFRLIEEGFDVDIAAPKKGHIEGEHGYALEVETTFDDIDPQDYDLLIVPGGAPDGAPAEVRKEKTAQNIANSFLKANKPVASICHGPWTLVSAGAVKGRRLTSFWGDGVPVEIKKVGGNHVDAEVVVDGNLVTSRYPGDLPKLVSETLKMFRKYSKER
jgi:protease I